MRAKAPARHHPPIRIAPDTWLIRQYLGEGEGPVTVAVNSLVIAGAEPVIVDTGAPNNRERWLDDVFSIVDPEDVRWVFLSHDDIDHTGNLDIVLESCRRAQLVTTFFASERMSVTIDPPLDRMRWVNDGDAFSAGDRTLVARRPPVFDSPTTRGLFDPTTGVYWASDAFAVPLPAPADDVEALEADDWVAGMSVFNLMGSPWISMVDGRRWEESIRRVETLGARILASAHSPVVTGDRVARAFDSLRNLPSVTPAPTPGQADLEAMIAAGIAA